MVNYNVCRTLNKRPNMQGAPMTNQSGVVSGSWPSTHIVTVKLSSKTSEVKAAKEDVFQKKIEK